LETNAKVNGRKSIVAMVCMTVISLYALVQGVDGMLTTAVVSALTGLGGFFGHKALAK